MNRREEYSGEIKRSYDDLKGWRDAYQGVGFLANDVIGGTLADTEFGRSPLLSVDATGVRTGITAGLVGSATYGLTGVLGGFDAVNAVGFELVIGQGTAYCFSATDNVGNILNGGGTSTGYGDLAADTTNVVHECYAAPSLITVTASAPTGSNILWYMLTVTPTVTDTTQSDDPNVSGTSPFNAILGFYNSANPQQPLAGPGGTNPPTQSTTVRQSSCTIRLQTATNTDATHVPTALTVPSTDLPLIVGYLTSSDTGINTSHIWYSGLGTCPEYVGNTPLTPAPFLRGLLEQHHLGVPGSAPQIDGGVEWLPLSTVNNNGKAIKNVLANVATSIASYGTDDFVTINSQLATALAPQSMGTGSGSGSGSFSSTSLTLTVEVAFIPNHTAAGGSCCYFIINGQFNFTLTGSAQGNYYEFAGCSFAGVTNLGNLTNLAAVISMQAGTSYPFLVPFVNMNASNPTDELDIGFVLLTANDGTWSRKFTILVAGY